MLVKQDIATKKRALQEEKQLINERLNTRLKAEQDEERYSELSELQRQIALIASDPTRTKDVKEMQKKIDDLLKTNANEIAKQEAQAAQERIDDEIKAYDEYTAYQETKLNEMLKDANSTALAEELQAVMQPENRAQEDDLMQRLNTAEEGSAEYKEIYDELKALRDERFNNYMDWIRQNDETYKYGTEAMRLQMEESNSDNWNKMIGFVETYWDEVREIMDGGVGSILDFMKDSSSYRWASDTGRELLEINWKNIHEAFEDAYKDNAEFNHEHDILIDDLEDEVFEINRGIQDIYGIEKNLYDLFTGNVENDYVRPTDVADEANWIPYKDYAGTGKKEMTINGKEITRYGEYVEEDAENPSGYRYRFVDKDGKVILSGAYKDELSALEAVQNKVMELYKGDLAKSMLQPVEVIDKNGKVTYKHDPDPLKTVYAQAKGTTSGYMGHSSNAADLISNAIDSIKEKKNVIDILKGRHFASGGLVDYTGPAWVDGTKTRPESFLDAVDTENIKRLTDVLDYVHVSPFTHVGTDLLTGGNNQTVGDVNIVINQASIRNDADIEKLANQVGRQFTKQLSKQGLNLSGYAF